MAAVSGAKYEKYISSILEDMVFSKQGQTKTFFDLTTSTMMANSKKPIYRDIQIYVHHFPLQECVDTKQVILEHIRTRINLDDTSTKSLGWVLHNRQSGIMMGKYESTFIHIE